MTAKIATYVEFWPHYLREHSRPLNRALHYFGTALALLFLLDVARGGTLSVINAAVSGYVFAWVGHFMVEKNRPATFTYPWWSLISDFRMFGLFASGKLRRHLAAAGVV
jgi:hypothetical protein